MHINWFRRIDRSDAVGLKDADCKGRTQQRSERWPFTWMAPMRGGRSATFTSSCGAFATNGHAVDFSLHEVLVISAV